MYFSNNNEHKFLLFLFSIISVFCAFGLSKILKLINIDFWWIDLPSVWGFYLILYKLYSKCFWKIQIKKIHFSKTPNLNGKWQGKITSIYNKIECEIPFSAEIFQDWNRLQIILETKTSRSKSNYCFMSFDSPDGVYLTYTYLNQPKPGSPESMNTHTGINELLISKDCNSMTGDYFTGRGRGTSGRIVFSKGTSH